MENPNKDYYSKDQKHLFISVFLPNNQKTVLLFKPGNTLREALKKPLALRNLTPEKCLVFDSLNQALSWDDDVNLFKHRELTVKILEELKISAPITHNLARKTFFTISFCEVCHKMLFHGFRCLTCGFKFHQKCGISIPPFCEPIYFDVEFYKRFLLKHSDLITHHPLFNQLFKATPPYLIPPENNETMLSSALILDGLIKNKAQNFVSENINGILATSHLPKMTLEGSQRERSTSAPNMAVNGIANIFDFDHQPTFSAKKINNVKNDLHNYPYMFDFSSYATNQYIPFSEFLRKSRGPTIDTNTPENENYPETLDPNHHPMITRLHQNDNLSVRPRAKSADNSNATLVRNVVPTQQPLTPVIIKNSGNNLNNKTDLNDNIDNIRESGFIEWEINPNDLMIGPKIGTGSFGTVYRGKWHGPVAIKQLNISYPSFDRINAFKNEVAVLRKTRHVNILLFMGCVVDPLYSNSLAIVTQWCDGATLYKRLHIDEIVYTPVQIVDIARQISQGLDYLHAKSIIHRDLKSNNIFLLDDLTIKIGDFGLAAIKSTLSDLESDKQPTGSILWMSPEIIRIGWMKLKNNHQNFNTKATTPNNTKYNNDANSKNSTGDTNISLTNNSQLSPNGNDNDNNLSPYTFASDVYAFGIVLFELCTNTLPYVSNNNGGNQMKKGAGPGGDSFTHDTAKDVLLYRIGKGYLRPNITQSLLTGVTARHFRRKDIPKSFKRLAEECYAFNPEDRPLFPEILASLEFLSRQLPRIHKSISEPSISVDLSSINVNDFDYT